MKGLRLPYRFSSGINRLAETWALRLFLASRGCRKENTILWLFPPHPYLIFLMNFVPHKVMVTHIVDNFTRLSDDHWLRGYAEVQYPILHSASDLIFTGSKFNHDLFSKERSDTYLFPNAVDKDFLGLPRSPTWSQEKRNPRLVYVGTISERTDLELIEEIAQSRPEWEIHIAGLTEVSISERPLLSFPNVHYVGLLPYEEIPGFIDSMDVCLMPHKDTEYCRSMSPLKLYQYLASGRPIVATPVENVSELTGYVTIAERDVFIKAIEQVLHEDTAQESACRIEKAKTETWEHRVRNMFDVVKARIILLGKQ